MWKSLFAVCQRQDTASFISSPQGLHCWGWQSDHGVRAQRGQEAQPGAEGGPACAGLLWHRVLCPAGCEDLLPVTFNRVPVLSTFRIRHLPVVLCPLLGGIPMEGGSKRPCVSGCCGLCSPLPLLTCKGQGLEL